MRTGSCVSRPLQDDEDLNDSDDEHLTDDEHHELQKLSRSVNAEGVQGEEEVRGGWRVQYSPVEAVSAFGWSIAVKSCLHRL